MSETATITPLELLRRVRVRLDSPERWTRGEYARNKNGRSAFVDSEEATCWCLIGALWVESNVGDIPVEIRWAAQDVLAREVGFALPFFNDEFAATHGDVLLGLDRTIARLEKEEAQSAAS